jgi:Icc-related predicted phosphoesterase
VGDEPEEYLLSRLYEALASDERVNQLDIVARMHNGALVLTGSVQTAERRIAAESVARAVARGLDVVNQIDVRHFDGTSERAPRGAVRVAAVGDVHYGSDSRGMLRPHLEHLDREADLLLLAGDLTRHGTVNEALVLGDDLQASSVPVVGVLGNHDYQSGHEAQIAAALESGGVTVLEGTATTIDVRGVSVGIAGTKGFGGGFVGACGSEFGEPLMKQFIGHTRELADGLAKALRSLETDVRLALLHFSPSEETLRGERLEIFPWLGSYLLADAIDHAGCDYAFHGHAHAGTEIGSTAGGVPVRNVAQPVIGVPYRV